MCCLLKLLELLRLQRVSNFQLQISLIDIGGLWTFQTCQQGLNENLLLYRTLLDLDKRYFIISRQEVDLTPNIPRLHGPEDISVVKVPALLLITLDDKVFARLQTFSIANALIYSRRWHR